MSVIATRQQIGRSPNRAKTSNGRAGEKAADADEPYDDSFFGVAREIIEEEGVTGLWLGIQPGLVLTVNPAITYGAFERVKSILLLAQERATGVAVSANSKLNPWTAFMVGALSKTLATVVRILFRA